VKFSVCIYIPVINLYSGYMFGALVFSLEMESLVIDCVIDLALAITLANVTIPED